MIYSPGGLRGGNLRCSTPKVVPCAEGHENVAAYLARLMERPSFARVVAEAQPHGPFPRLDLSRAPAGALVPAAASGSEEKA